MNKSSIPKNPLSTPMVSSISKSESAGLPSGIKAPVQETLLTPRFYTTNFDALAEIDLSGQQAELEAGRCLIRV